MSAPIPNAHSLRKALAGEVITQGETGWDAARQAWNLTADQRPSLVVLADSAADIEATVQFAVANGLRVAPQSTGHGASSMGDLEATILLKTSRLADVSIDPKQRTARVAAGALWSDVVAPAGKHGLVGLHGLSAGVGVAGYVLGGGIGWLSRRDGFASSHVRAFETIGVDGEAKRVEASSDPELFWVLRGGGGRPVVVTSFELELFALREAFAGALMWPIEEAESVLAVWREWVASVPNEATSTIKLLRFPALPTVAEKLRGRAMVAIVLAFTGTGERGAELVAPLRAVGAPEVDTLTTIAATGLADVAGDPTDPTPALGYATLIDHIGTDQSDALLALAGPGVDTPLASVEIRHLGGALRDPASDPGAAGRLDAEGLLYCTARVTSPQSEETIRAAQREARERFAPFAGVRNAILTFDERRPMRGAFEPDVADRIEAICRKRDPEGLFVSNHAAD